MNTKKQTIGLFGYGTVAKGFHNYLLKDNNYKLTDVVVKSANKERPNKTLNYITDEKTTLTNNTISTIVEAINNDEDAFRIISEALKQGKNVVSASKKALANNLGKLLQIEKENNATLLFEPAVAGSIPILRILNDFYKNEDITSIKGILNGSSNYILSQLFESEKSYEQALQEAQEKGFAEKDPTSDVGGFDAKYKAILIAALAFGTTVKADNILTVGIESVSKKDIDLAKSLNLKIKQIAKLEYIKGKLSISVLPTLVNSDNELFQTNQEYNGIQINSKNIGTQFYKGKGAGSNPTGFAVYSDTKALENDYRYHYTKNSIPFSSEFSVKFLIRIPSSYEFEQLPLIVEKLHQVEEGLFYVKTSQQELINKYETLKLQGFSLLFFDNETIKENITGKIKEITPKELNLLKLNSTDLELIDVREQWEYEIANIGGKLFPLKELENYVPAINKTKKVVVICRSGKRSISAIELLQKKYNFKNLYNLKGGILAWSDEVDSTIKKY